MAHTKAERGLCGECKYFDPQTVSHNPVGDYTASLRREN